MHHRKMLTRVRNSAVHSADFGRPSRNQLQLIYKIGMSESDSESKSEDSSAECKLILGGPWNAGYWPLADALVVFIGPKSDH